MNYIFNDGGRSKYFKAEDVGDCVTRAIAIVTNRDYKEIYEEIKNFVGYSPRNGLYRKDTKKVIAHFGGKWMPLMKIGSVKRTHVKREELPSTGRFILNLSKHVSAWIDGESHDTYDVSRDGTRLVYGYWKFS